MEAALFIFYFALLCSCIAYFSFYKLPGIRTSWVISAFVLKVAVGFLTWLFYLDSLKSMPQGDIFSFVHDGKILHDAVYESPADYVRLLFGLYPEGDPMELKHLNGSTLWHQHFVTGYINDNRVFVRLNSVFSFFSLNSIHIHSLFINFLSFTGLIALYKTFRTELQGKEKLLFIVLFMMPSVLFWGSSLLKESFMLFNFGMFIYFFNKAIEKKSVSPGGAGLFFLFLSLICKPYVILCLLLPFLAWLYNRYRSPQRVWLAYVLSMFSVVLLVFAVNAFSGRLLSSLVKKQNDFINLSKGGMFLTNDSIILRIDPLLENQLEKNTEKNTFTLKKDVDYLYWKLNNIDDTLTAKTNVPLQGLTLVWDIKPAGSAIRLSRLENSWWSVFRILPYSFYNGFFRPTFSDVHNSSSLVSAVELSAYMLCLIILLLFFRARPVNVNLLFLSVTFILLLCCLIGLTVPVLGSTVRYRIPATIFLGILLVNLFDVNSAFTIFKRKR